MVNIYYRKVIKIKTDIVIIDEELGEKTFMISQIQKNKIISLILNEISCIINKK